MSFIRVALGAAPACREFSVNFSYCHVRGNSSLWPIIMNTVLQEIQFVHLNSKFSFVVDNNLPEELLQVLFL